MYRVPPDRAWWPAVGAPLERGVRHQCGGLAAEVAGRIGITQAAYAQMERVKQPRKATIEKVAAALGLEVEQLRW